MVSDCEWSPTPKYSKPSFFAASAISSRRGGAVAVGRVVVEDAADVVASTSAGSFFASAASISPVSSRSLRRDVVELERLVDVRFGLAGIDFFSFAERVLVERQPAVDRPLPQADVVLLAAGEVEQGERELLVVDARAGRR